MNTEAWRRRGAELAATATERARGLAARGVAVMNAAWFRQRWADLRDSFWVRPAAMTLTAAVLSAMLIRAEGTFAFSPWLGGWIYAGGAAGARDVLGTIAAAMIGVAGTTFSITVAALTLASNQMGPRLLSNFTRDPGNQYTLGALLATFAYSLVALRSVHQGEDGDFVPHLAVSVALILAIGCLGVLIWFLHHVATAISVDQVVALVQKDLSGAIAELPVKAAAGGADYRAELLPRGASAALRAPGAGYLRVLDDAGLAKWADGCDAFVRLRVRPGDFLFPGSQIGEVWPATCGEEAQGVLDQAVLLGTARNIEQDIEFAVRQMVEIALRALSPGINDPFTAIAVLDRLGAALCELSGRTLPSGCTAWEDRARVVRTTTTYPGLLDAMFHMLRQAGSDTPSVMIRLLEVLIEVARLEHDPQRCEALHAHVELARAAGTADTQDPPALRTIAERHAEAAACLDGTTRALPAAVGQPVG